MSKEPTPEEVSLFGLNDAQLRARGMTNEQIADLRAKQWTEAEPEPEQPRRARRVTADTGDAS